MWPSHFYLDVCPHCSNWFVFILRCEYTNMASGLERHPPSTSQTRLSLPLSLHFLSWMFPIWQDLMQLPPHATTQWRAYVVSFNLLLPHGLFGRFIINSHHVEKQCWNRHDFANLSKDSRCVRLKLRHLEVSHYGAVDVATRFLLFLLGI